MIHRRWNSTNIAATLAIWPIKSGNKSGRNNKLRRKSLAGQLPRSENSAFFDLRAKWQIEVGPTRFDFDPPIESMTWAGKQWIHQDTIYFHLFSWLFTRIIITKKSLKNLTWDVIILGGRLPVDPLSRVVLQLLRSSGSSVDIRAVCMGGCSLQESIRADPETHQPRRLKLKPKTLQSKTIQNLSVQSIFTGFKCFLIWVMLAPSVGRPCSLAVRGSSS